MAPIKEPKRRIRVEPLPEPGRRPRVVPPSRRRVVEPEREPETPQREKVPA
jgi:hypothetical protein